VVHDCIVMWHPLAI